MKYLTRCCLLLTLVAGVLYGRGAVNAAATPSATTLLYLPLTFTPGTPPAAAPLYIATMTHMEGSFRDDVDEDLFNQHVQQIRWGMDLFDEYEARLTIESEKPFARANTIWGLNIMQEIVNRGHGVGTHCDIGFREPLMPVAEFAALLQENKTLVDGLVGAANNRGCSGAGGVNDWALAGHLAGFGYINGIVGMHYLSMPLANRPDATWTDAFIYQVGFHYNAPVDINQRIHPFMVVDATDFVADEDGVILVSSGELGALHMAAEGPDANCGPQPCPLTMEDITAILASIAAAAAYHDPTRIGKLTVHVPIHLYLSENEALLRAFLEGIATMVNAGTLTWATQGEVYDAYLSWP